MGLSVTRLRALATDAALRWARRARAKPYDAMALAFAVAATCYVVAYPFTVVTYPPITDLPFHAAESSIVRHYFDPAFHFREQFELHFLQVPYATLYLLGAFFALFLPMVWATKLTAIVLLAMLPLGLAVLFYGMKKSPLWGLLGLGMVWSLLTHWGFLNFMGAIGLFAMVMGLTLMVLDRPSAKRQVWLSLALFAVFCTHIYRFPFAVATVVGITILMYPATRKIRPVALPLASALATYGLWSLIRKASVPSEMGPIGVHPERLREIPDYLFAAWIGTEEWALAQAMLVGYGALFVLAAVLFIAQGRLKRRPFREWWWGGAVTALPLLVGSVFVVVYLTLPMSIGLWWFVYPREITTAVYIGLAAMPDLPRQAWLRLPMIAAFVLLSGRLAFLTATHWHEFDQSNADFVAMMAEVPPAPKLMYLIFDHSGSARRVTPYIHLPAWVQAQKGGWLSFHFAGWGDLNPVRYHQGGEVPPTTPDRWEWTPERFNLQSNGSFFDTFLVRNAQSPDHLFAADPAIHRIAHHGTWWLYRRGSK